jgi:hypothetical protein
MSTKSKSLIGSAGVFYVCAELNMNGLVALPTVRNSKGPDILVTSQRGDILAVLQVKTSSNRVSKWPIGVDYRHFQGERHYYVFVRYINNERFEAFLVSAADVIQSLDNQLIKKRHGKSKSLMLCWHLPKDSHSKTLWRYLSRFEGRLEKGGLFAGGKVRSSGNQK